jgi:uncharacterized YigZ family protein
MPLDHTTSGSNLKRYRIPARETRAELSVVNSRFIASAAPVFSVEEARSFIAKIRTEFTDATHHVPAFIIGYGASITEHCSDDGEPSGTAGRPALAVLQGSGLGDIAVVVTRYFGGTKLGTGGLVRAYTDAVKTVLAVLPLAMKIPTHLVMTSLPYKYFERGRMLAQRYGGEIVDEDFAADITLSIRFDVEKFDGFNTALIEMTNGQCHAEIIQTDPETILPLTSSLLPED